MKIDERGNLAGPRPTPRRGGRLIQAAEYFKALSNCRAVMGITAARATGGFGVWMKERVQAYKEEGRAEVHAAPGCQAEG
jgi:hypothetical protein